MDEKALRSYLSRLRDKKAEVGRKLSAALKVTDVGIFTKSDDPSKAQQILRDRAVNLYEEKSSIERSIETVKKKLDAPKEEKKKKASQRSRAKLNLMRLSSRGRSGGGGGGMNLASRGRSRSLLQQIKDSSGPLNE